MNKGTTLGKRVFAALLTVLMILSVQPQPVLASPGDTDITEVNLNGVSSELWSYQDVTFATLDEESNYTIESQKWSSDVGDITPSSTGLKPTAGKEIHLFHYTESKGWLCFSDRE